MKITGIRLRELRESHGLMPNQVARTIGMPLSSYIAWEKGERKRGINDLILFAKFYKVSTDYLLGIENHARLEK